MSEGKTEKNAHLWERHPEDWYVEPTWCSKRLFEVERFEGLGCDPACGMGRIVEAAQADGYAFRGKDLVSRSPLCQGTGNFLEPRWEPPAPFPYLDFIVSNPPFGKADEFVDTALSRARRKVAMLLPANWHVSDKRGQWLRTTPLYRVWVCTPRPSMPPGPVIEAGIKPGNGSQDFAWYVWLQGYDGNAELRWLRRDGA